MSILTLEGRATLAAAVKAMPLHLAWGAGDGAWTDTPAAESSKATALLSEIGRRTATIVEFVTPDAVGDIEISGAGKYSVSVAPTRNLYVSTKFDFADASAATIREIGLFTNTVVVGGLPVGQRYFTPAEIANDGQLLQLENIAAIVRSASTRETFDILIVF